MIDVRIELGREAFLDILSASLLQKTRLKSESLFSPGLNDDGDETIELAMCVSSLLPSAPPSFLAKCFPFDRAPIKAGKNRFALGSSDQYSLLQSVPSELILGERKRNIRGDDYQSKIFACKGLSEMLFPLLADRNTPGQNSLTQLKRRVMLSVDIPEENALLTTSQDRYFPRH